MNAGNKPLKKSWASLASEDDLGVLLSDTIRSEFLDNVQDDAADLFRSFSERISTQCEAEDSPRSLDEPVFGFTSSPFAPSSAEIESLRTLFDDYVFPTTETPREEQAHSGDHLRRECAEECRQWPREDRVVAEEALQRVAAGGADFPSLWLPPTMPMQPPPPPPNPRCVNGAACARCGSRQMEAKGSGWLQCHHCGFLVTTEMPQATDCASPSSGPCSSNAARDPQSHMQFNRRSKRKERANFLQDFKQKDGNGYRLSDLWGHMLALSRDQAGSRFLQKALSEASASDQERYFHEISYQALTVASDVFGNFIVQVLLESKNPNIDSRLVQIMKPHMVELSTRPYGCRVVQRAFETLPYEHKSLLASSLEGSVESCAHNEHGNHVLQRCLQHLDAPDIAFIYSVVASRTRIMSKDKYGCRVVQKAIEHRHQSAYADPIRKQIATYAVEFAFDEFANFVVQKLLWIESPEIVDNIIKQFIPYLMNMSCQKYPSNVVETSLDVCTPDMAQRLKRRILGTDIQDNTARLTTIIRDRFGRYVVEKLIKFCVDPERMMIRKTAEQILRQAQNDVKQRSIVKRVQRLLQALQQ